MSAELLDATREVAVIRDGVLFAARHRDSQASRVVPMEEWDDATAAACRAANAAQSRLTDLCVQMFPQPGRNEVWKEYSARFWPNTVRF